MSAGLTNTLSAYLTKRPLSVWLIATLIIIAIGVVDYLTGTDLRIFPLYYVPVSFVAWYRGLYATLIASVICTLAWFESNLLAGMYFLPSIWLANMLVQTLSFGIVGILISILQASVIREHRLSRTDLLTMLPNGRAFYEEANKILAQCRGNGQPVTLAHLDLDNFKTVNDAFGHKIGDDLLCIVADRLRAFVQSSGIYARLGGDEFVIMFPEIGPEEASATLDRLQSSMEGINSPDQRPVSVNIGAVIFTMIPKSVEDMVQQADDLMFEAKKAGKKRMFCY